MAPGARDPSGGEWVGERSDSHFCWRRSRLCVDGGRWRKCWGRNDRGQLGNGTDHYSESIPVDVSGLGSGVIAIAAAFDHTCALTTGGVKCWGYNNRGQLGDGTTLDHLTPVDVNELGSGVGAIVAGYDYTCALMANGGVKCWGNNDRGQLGVNPGWTPVDAVGFGGGETHVVTGSVKDAAGTGIVWVTVSGGGCSATTDASGGYTLEGLPTGTHLLTPSKSGYIFSPASQSATVPPSALGINFTGTAIPSVVTGSVKDAAGVGIAGVTISGGGRSTTTDVGGGYTLEGLLTGTHTLTPSKSGYTFSPVARAVTVPPNALGINFTGRATTSVVTGSVKDTAGVGIAGVVSISGGGRSTTTDAGGGYTLEGLPAGTHTLTPSKSGYTFSPASKSVIVPPNALGINFTGTAATSVVTGSVKDAAGFGISGVTISGGGRSTTTDAGGGYTLEGYRPARIRSRRPRAGTPSRRHRSP